MLSTDGHLCAQKIIKFGRDLTKFWQKHKNNFARFFSGQGRGEEHGADPDFIVHLITSGGAAVSEYF